MSILISIFLGLLLVVPAIGSVFICVPVWWTNVIKSHIPQVSTGIDWQKQRWYLAPVRWSYMIPVVPLILLCMIFVSYIYVVFAFIERKCSYTHDHKLQNEYKDFKGSVHNAACEMFDFALGRD